MAAVSIIIYQPSGLSSNTSNLARRPGLIWRDAPRVMCEGLWAAVGAREQTRLCPAPPPEVVSDRLVGLGPARLWTESSRCSARRMATWLRRD
ncbi:hypothetical protein FJT64_012498 [Amphibalanus amphitrite]|uniref:Uncharacterized protein n=1 Tax=Amphibalanus amphitrite TaxID=1232801 RepID=A0A6A4V3H6_AMPAM|nr:hypothetical protein FJT64_012498 [Amphibalanus amphitrite]